MSNSTGPLTRERYESGVRMLALSGDRDYHVKRATEWLKDAVGRLAQGDLISALDSLNVARHSIDAVSILVHHEHVAEHGARSIAPKLLGGGE